MAPQSLFSSFRLGLVMLIDAELCLAQLPQVAACVPCCCGCEPRAAAVRPKLLMKAAEDWLLTSHVSTLPVLEALLQHDTNAIVAGLRLLPLTSASIRSCATVLPCS